MDVRRTIERSSRAGVSTSSNSQLRTMTESVNDCREYIQKHASTYMHLKPDAKKTAIQQLVLQYVTEQKPLVEGFVTSSGASDVTAVIKFLMTEITDYGILSAAIADEAVFEIQVNGRVVWIEKNGQVQLLRDVTGRPVEFKSPEQQDTLIRRLLGDVRYSERLAIASASTIEGFRIHVIHHSAMGRDSDDPRNNDYSSFVLRKFKKQKFTMSELIRESETFSDNMGKLFNLIIEGGESFVTCGRTASGKTTTNNAMLQSAPDDIRILLVQNPSEIDLRQRDAAGVVINNVVHYEAQDDADPKVTTSPTMQNLMASLLRLSPTMAVIGEARRNEEFALLMMIMNAGHESNATYHANDAYGAMRRFLTAYMASSGEGIETALPTLAAALRFIIIQDRLRDGRRRVLEVAEVLGVNPENNAEPLIRTLYKFEPEGEPIYDENGKLKLIPGKHVQKDVLSEATIRKLRLKGIPSHKYAQFTSAVFSPDTPPVEQYTGNWFGMEEDEFVSWYNKIHAQNMQN